MPTNVRGRPLRREKSEVSETTVKICQPGTRTLAPHEVFPFSDEMKLDVDFARAQFPAFSEPGLKDQAFFENAGGSYTCKPVIDRLFRFYTQHKVQPGHPFTASQTASAEMAEARTRISAILGVDEDELSFGPSTTQNTYVLAQAFAAWLKPGAAIVVTNQDHEANSGPWRRLAERGIEIREWNVDPETGLLDPDDLQALLDETVRLVCFPHCSNIVGAINPVVDITAIAHAAGAFVCVDGVSLAPHGLPNIGLLGPDIYLFSSYKTFGPHQGLMVVRRSLGALLPNQGHYFNAGSLSSRFTPAGPDHAQEAACAGMADYLDALHQHHGGKETKPSRQSGFVNDLIRAHETELLQPLLDWAVDSNSVRLIGPAEAKNRAPTVSLDLGRAALPVATALAERGIMAGCGDFYGVRVLEAMGFDVTDGVLRLSFTHYTSRQEIDKLLNALTDVL